MQCIGHTHSITCNMSHMYCLQVPDRQVVASSCPLSPLRPLDKFAAGKPLKPSDKAPAAAAGTVQASAEYVLLHTSPQF